MRATRLLRMLVLGRFVVGGGALVAPRLTGRLFGIDAGANPAAPYLGRLFGARAVLMGFLACTATGSELGRQLRAGVVVDAVDATAALAAGLRHELRPPVAALTFGAAVFEAGLGLRLIDVLAAEPGANDRSQC